MFLLIEDETGVANVIVTPPVYERHRLTVRTASLVTITGRLERREESSTWSHRAFARSSAPMCPSPRSVRSSPREIARPRDLSDLDAVLPVAHSFGRRGR